MPNIVVEYTANIRAEADIPGLLKAISRTVQEVGRGAFALAAVRVRAIECQDYVIGDDDPDYAFVLIDARLAKGRAEEDVRRTFDAVWKAVQAHLAPVSAKRMLAITMDVGEFGDRLAYKDNPLHARFGTKPLAQTVG